MNGINLKGFAVRSFTIRGLTAKWGIGENRVPPIWDNNLIGYWDARSLPNGAVSTVANKATLATKAPDLTVIGATMADGTLQFDGVNDEAYTTSFAFPEKFTVFWDIDWLGGENGASVIAHGINFGMWNTAAPQLIRFHMKTLDSSAQYPNSVVGISTAKLVYDKTGRAQAYTADVGRKSQNTLLRVGVNGSRQFYTKMGFRQLLIFNKELSLKEVAEVLEVMYNPTYAEDFTSIRWVAFTDRATATVTKSKIHVTKIIMNIPFVATTRETYANKMRVRVSGISGTGKTLYYRYGNPNQGLEITEDGIYTLPQGVYSAILGGGYNGFIIAPVGVCDITIAQLPV